jgi:hypothetical protein
MSLSYRFLALQGHYRMYPVRGGIAAWSAIKPYRLGLWCDGFCGDGPLGSKKTEMLLNTFQSPEG